MKKEMIKMLRGYWPLIGGLASFLVPFAIANIAVWNKKSVLHSSKIAYNIASSVVCLFFIVAVLVAMLHG